MIYIPVSMHLCVVKNPTAENRLNPFYENPVNHLVIIVNKLKSCEKPSAMKVFYLYPYNQLRLPVLTSSQDGRR